MAPEEEAPEQAEHTAPGEVGPGSGPADQTCGSLRAECERLCQDVRRLEQERDEYRHMLYQAMAKYCDAVHGELTEAKLLDRIANEKWVPFEDVLSELEQIGRGR